MAEANARPLLVELFVEELPPKTLKKLSTTFAEGLVAALRSEGLVAEGAVATPFATPRRLAVLIDAVAARAADSAVSLKLMPASVGLDAAGGATPALLKKLAALGTDVSVLSALQRRLDGKSETLFLDRVAAGATLAEGLQHAIERAIAQLPIAKLMQYQLADGWTSVSFVRPAHGLVALHGNEVVPVRALGLDAGRETKGHRFEARQTPIAIRSAESYERQLESEGAVLAGFGNRRAEISRQLRAASDAAGLAPIDDDALLDEVTALVERPNVVTCRFDSAFLEVPPECLMLTMKANQKYFPLLDAGGKLTNSFLVVCNITPADPTCVIEGNERVVRPRLADAKFFYDQDKKRSLASRVAALDKVVYHGALGSQGERVERVRRLARWVAERIGADVADADRAALLAKADLSTDMVGEFPELQGIMGGYYAAHDGEAADVVAAIRGQYVNRRSESDEATNLVGEALLIADRAETLVGIWSVGLRPTGDKDPHALRRHALTLIASFEAVLAFSQSPRLFITDLLEEAAATFSTPVASTVVVEVEAFIFERYLNQLAVLFDARAVDSVVGLRPPLHEVVKRVHAVRDFLQLPEAAALAAANKRVGNILKKSTEAIPAEVDAKLLEEPAERALAAALDQIGTAAQAAFNGGRYAESLRLLAGLKVPVDAFFDGVMVNAESAALRANRLALLSHLRATMNRVADLSRLAG